MSYILEAPHHSPSAFLTFMGDLISQHDREEHFLKGSSLLPNALIEELRGLYLQSRVDHAVLREAEASLQPLRHQLQNALGLPEQKMQVQRLKPTVVHRSELVAADIEKSTATAFEIVGRLSTYLRPLVEEHPERLLRYGFSLVRSSQVSKH